MEDMKIGDLVKHGDEMGIYLGEKTYGGNYTCSMVFFPGRAVQKNGGPNPCPIQSDILEVVSHANR
jgi:hypothetical protein